MTNVKRIKVVPNHYPIHYPMQKLFQFIVKITDFRCKGEIFTGIYSNKKEAYEDAMRIQVAFY